MAGVGGEEECRFLGVVLLVDVGASDGDEQSTYCQEPIVGCNDERGDRFLIRYSCKITMEREGDERKRIEGEGNTREKEGEREGRKGD